MLDMLDKIESFKSVVIELNENTDSPRIPLIVKAQDQSVKDTFTDN